MERGIFEIVDTESLVPAEHLLRKIDAAVDFTRIYDMVEPLYCADNTPVLPNAKQGFFYGLKSPRVISVIFYCCTNGGNTVGKTAKYAHCN